MIIYLDQKDLAFIRQNPSSWQCVNIMKYLLNHEKVFKYDIGCPIPITIKLEFYTPILNTEFLLGGLTTQMNTQHIRTIGPIGIQREKIDHTHMSSYTITLKEPNALPIFKSKCYTSLFAYSTLKDVGFTILF
jgi:hypothetical protein